MQKFEITNHLARRLQSERYLEICTPCTGLAFAQVLAGGQCKRYDRLMYNCPDAFEDGSPITFRTSQPCANELIRNLRAAFDQRPMYDIVFVDPWHSLACSAADLAGAWRLLHTGGVMVVHDCSPDSADLASPSPPEPFGSWCGVTYQAFVEFLMSGLPSDVCTVDSDFGVGVVFKDEHEQPSDAVMRVAAHAPNWHLIRNDDIERFAYFTKHRGSLLNLISPQEFLDRFACANAASEQRTSDVAA